MLSSFAESKDEYLQITENISYTHPRFRGLRHKIDSKKQELMSRISFRQLGCVMRGAEGI